MQLGCQAWLLLAQQRCLDACQCDVLDIWKSQTRSSSTIISSARMPAIFMQVDAVAWENLSEVDRATIKAMGVEAAKLSSGGELDRKYGIICRKY